MLGEGILSRTVPNVQSLFNRQTCVTSITEAAVIMIIFQKILFCKVKPQMSYTKRKITETEPDASRLLKSMSASEDSRIGKNSCDLVSFFHCQGL